MTLRPQSYRNTIVVDGTSFSSRLGKSPWMSPSHYQVEVVNRLRFIESKTRSGKALLDALSGLRGSICRIIPAAYASPDQTVTAPVEGGRCVIEFNPWTWNFEDYLLKIDPDNRGYDPDDVLFHELVHAFLQLARIFRSVPRKDQYDNREDFYAVLFTNIYVSERDKLSAADISDRLRGSHNLKFESIDLREPDIAQARNPSVRFYKTYKDEIDDLFHTDNAAMTALAEDLAAVSCSFNPVRARPKSEYIPFESPFGDWVPK